MVSVKAASALSIKLNEDLLQSNEHGRAHRDHDILKGRGEEEAHQFNWQKAIFQTFYTILTPPIQAGNLWYTEHVLMWLQMLSFPLSDSKEFQWDGSMLSRLTKFLSLLSIRGLGSDQMKEIATIAAVTSILTVISSLFWVGVAVVQERRVAQTSLKVVRLALRAMTGVLMVPLLTNLLRPLNCPADHGWLSSSLQCYTWLHSILVVVVLLIAITYLLLCGFLVTAWVDRRLRSDNPAAMAHGRVALGMMVIRMSLVASFTMDYKFHRTMLVVVTTICSLSALYIHATYLPYYRLVVNQFHTACAAVVCWGALAVALLEIRCLPEANVESFLFLLGTPSIAYVGRGLCMWTYNRVLSQRDANGSYMVELRVRILLWDSEQQEFGRPAAASVHERLLEACEQMFADALADHHSPPVLNIFLSLYVRTYRRNTHVELLHLSNAEAKEPALDIQYYIFERRLQIHEADSASTTSSVLARIKVESLRAEADHLMVHCYRRQADFWSELTKLRPSLPVLTSAGSDLEASLAKCEDLFQKMLALSPHSVVVLRMYGRFLNELCNNPLKAVQYEKQADDYAAHTGEDIDKLIGSELVLYQPHQILDATREDLAVFTVGQSSGNLGAITSANAVALEQFGYSKREIIGKNCDIIIPDPINKAHQWYMGNYIRTGREAMMTKSRVMFGKHKRGYIFPILLNATALDSCLVSVIHKLTTTDEFVWFYAKSLTVCGVTAKSASLFGVSPDTVERGTVKLSRYLDESLLRELLHAEDWDATLTEQKRQQTGARRSSLKSRLVKTQFLNVSSRFGAFGMCVNCDSGDDSSTIPVFPVNIRLQVTPFLQTGFVAHHQPKNADDDRLVILTWNVESSSRRGSQASLPDRATVAPKPKARRASRSQPPIHIDVAEEMCQPCVGGARTIAESTPGVQTDEMTCFVFSGAESQPDTAKTTLGVSQPIITAKRVALTLTTSTRPDASSKRYSSSSSRVFPLDDDPAPNDKTASVTSSGKALATEVRTAFERNNQSEDRVVTLLRRLFLGMVLGIAILAIVFGAFSKSFIADGVRSALSIRSFGDRMVYEQLVAFWTGMLCVAGAGLPTRLNYNASATQLQSVLANLAATHNYINTEFPPRTDAQAKLISGSHYLMSVLQGGIPATQNQTFIDMMGNFVSSASNVIHLPPSQAQRSQTDVWLVLNNARQIMDIMNQSLVLVELENTVELMENDLLTQIQVVALCLLGAPIVLGVFPVMYFLQSRRTKLFAMLLLVPIRAAKLLNRQASRRAARLQSEMKKAASEGDGAVVESDGEEDQEGLHVDWSSVPLEVQAAGPRRKFLGNFRWGTGIRSKLIVPLLLCMLYFYLITQHSYGVKDKIVDSHRSIYFTVQREAHAMSALLFTIQTLMAPSLPEAKAFADVATLELDMLMDAEMKLFMPPLDAKYSSDLTVGDDLRILFLKDGCHASVNQPECRTISHTVFVKGLHAVIQYFDTRIRDLIASRLDPTAPSIPGRLLLDPRWAALELLAVYLDEGLHAAGKYRATSIASIQTSFSSGTDTATACFIVGLLVVFAVYYVPIFRSLSVVLKHARSAVLMVPQEIMPLVPGLLHVMEDNAKKRF